MIITIGRECGCGADEIGKILSEKYKLPCYEKLELVEYAKERGLYDKFPYFFGEIPTDFPMSSLDENLMERVRNTPKEALGEFMKGQDCIIIGRTSNYVFRSREDSIRIFLCADIKYRIAQIIKSMVCLHKKLKNLWKRQMRGEADINNITLERNGDLQVIMIYL